MLGEQYIEFSFDIKNGKLGEFDNIPISLAVHFEHFRMKSLMFSFFVGEIGYLRTLKIYGNSKNGNRMGY